MLHLKPLVIGFLGRIDKIALFVCLFAWLDLIKAFRAEDKKKQELYIKIIIVSIVVAIVAWGLRFFLN